MIFATKKKHISFNIQSNEWFRNKMHNFGTTSSKNIPSHQATLKMGENDITGKLETLAFQICPSFCCATIVCLISAPFLQATLKNMEKA